MVSIVVPVLLLIGIALVVARGTDPGAAHDRDAAEKALLTNSELGGTFHETAHRAFARSRSGIRVEDAVAECASADAVFEKNGQAVVDSILQSQSGGSAQAVIEEVMIVKSAADATPVMDAIVGTARSCAAAALHQAAGSSITLQLTPTTAPELGDRAYAFAGTAGNGVAAAAYDVLIVQQGRAIVLVSAFDTTGSFGQRLAGLTDTVLAHLLPTFGP